MHNKRIGRDDVLKIEVRHLNTLTPQQQRMANTVLVGSYSPVCFVAL
jgi:hypothetical protein